MSANGRASSPMGKKMLLRMIILSRGHHQLHAGRRHRCTFSTQHRNGMRPCRQEIILPDMDPRTCACMSLAIFRKPGLQHGGGAQSQWLFCRGMTTSCSETFCSETSCSETMIYLSPGLRIRMTDLDPIQFERLLPQGAGNKDVPKMILTAELDRLPSKCKTIVWTPSSVGQMQTAQAGSASRECASVSARSNRVPR